MAIADVVIVTFQLILSFSLSFSSCPVTNDLRHGSLRSNTPDFLRPGKLLSLPDSQVLTTADGCQCRMLSGISSWRTQGTD
jgi:hypothetical protein